MSVWPASRALLKVSWCPSFDQAGNWSSAGVAAEVARVGAGLFATLTTVLKFVYLLSRGIAKASRVVAVPAKTGE
jgi:hypothetical protein